MKKLRIVLSAVIVSLLISSLAFCADRWKAGFPDILGYKTLKCDLHMHTVFSDGLVWPTARIDEAVREGLDVIAITDHIEYLPHKNDIPTNHNRSYEIAAGPAKKRGVLLIKGAEITRETPPGHFNTLFLNDIAMLDVKEFLDAVEAANNCHFNIRLQRTGETGPEELLLPAAGSVTLKAKIAKDADRIELAYTAENMLVAPEKGLPVKITAVLQ